MTSPLVPCPACTRHVRADEATCPFCSETLPTDLAKRAVPGTSKRLTRAATFAFAASVSAFACSSGGGDSGNDGGGPAPLYGAPVVDSGSETSPDGGGPVPAYGLPAPDAGPDAVGDTGAGGVLYGLPPPDAQTD